LLAQAGDRVGSAACIPGLELRRQAVERQCRDGPEQAGRVTEVVRRRGRRHARPARDLAERKPLDAAFGKQGLGGVDQRLRRSPW